MALTPGLMVAQDAKGFSRTIAVARRRDWNRLEHVDAGCLHHFLQQQASKNSENKAGSGKLNGFFFAKTKWYQKKQHPSSRQRQTSHQLSREMPTTVRSLAQATVKTVALVRGHHGLIALQRPGLSDDIVIGFLGDKISGIPKPSSRNRVAGNI